MSKIKMPEIQKPAGADRFRSVSMTKIDKIPTQSSMMKPKLPIGQFDELTVKLGNMIIDSIEKDKKPLNSRELTALEYTFALNAKMQHMD